MITIKVLIVDDNENNAERLNDVILTYTSNFPDCIQYTTVVIDDLATYLSAKKFIERNQSTISIMLIDYNLGNQKGTELFKLVNSKKYLIYKILHSITDQSSVETIDEHTKIFDTFCGSKSKEKIEKKLKVYEKEVLSILIFGNPFYNKTHLENGLRLKDEFTMAVKKILYFNILYIISKGKDRYEIHYRNENYDEKSIMDSTYTFEDYINSDLPFKKANRDLLINLVWVSKIDEPNNTVRFITNNPIHEITFDRTAKFDTEIKPHLSNIDSYIPDFFKR